MTLFTDRTAPAVNFYDTPEVVSNQTSYTFTFGCNEECSTQCRLHEKGTQASFSSCAGGISRYTKRYNTGSLTSDVMYVFEVKPMDVVGNEGEILTFEWQTGKHNLFNFSYIRFLRYNLFLKPRRHNIVKRNEFSV